MTDWINFLGELKSAKPKNVFNKIRYLYVGEIPQVPSGIGKNNAETTQHPNSITKMRVKSGYADDDDDNDGFIFTT